MVFRQTPHVAVPPERQKGVLLRVGGKSNRWDGVPGLAGKKLRPPVGMKLVEEIGKGRDRGKEFLSKYSRWDLVW